MTLARKLSLGALAIVVALFACAAWILATESGARFVLARAQAYLPAGLELGPIRGSFIAGTQFAWVNWESETLDVAIRDLSLEVEWARLLSRHLAVRSIDVAEMDIVSRAAAESESGGLPSVDLPIQVSIDSSSLRNVTVRQEDLLQAIDEIRVSGSMKAARLDVSELVVRSSWLNANLDGRVTATGDYPGRVRLDWQWRTSASQEFAGQLQVQGDLRRYDVEHTLQLPHGLSTNGHFSFVDNLLEFDLSNTWAELEWPVGESTLKSTGGTLSLAGNLSNIDLSLGTSARLDDLPEVRINLEGVADPGKIRLTRFDADTDSGRFVASGDVRWQPAPSFDLIYALEGRINDQPLGGGGTLGYAQGQFTVSNGRIELGSNRLELAGAVGDRLALDAEVDLPSIGELLPDASGNLSANVELRGSREQPEGRIEARAIDLSWSDFGIGSLVVDAELTPPQDLALSVILEKIVAADAEVDSASFAAAGTLDQHVLRTEIRSDGNQVAAETSGVYADGQWSGQAGSLEISSVLAGAWSLREPVDLLVSRDALSVSNACLQSATGVAQACVQAAATRSGPTTFDLAISDLPLSTLPVALPANVTPGGFINVQAVGSVSDSRVTGEGSLSLRDASIEAVVDDEIISAGLTRAAAEISLVDNRAVTSLRLDLADDIGSTALDFAVDDVMNGESAVTGRGTVEITDLSLLAVLLPDIARPRGIIDGSLDISGTLDAPQLVGTIGMSDGGFGFRRTGIEITDINARIAQLSAGRLQLEGSARSGDGQIRIRGDTWASADAGIRSEFLVTGEDFELSRLPDWQVAASPSVAIVFDDRVTTVTGNLFIPTTDVRVRDIPETAESASPDAVVHSSDGSEPVARRRIDVDVAVGLGDAVRFAGFGLSTGIEGAVRIRGGTHNPYTGSGRLSLSGGRYKAYGQDLEIERGQLIFNGPLDNPQLDVRAVRRLTDVTAGIALSGTPSQLRSSLFSEPPLGDAETLSYLLTGRPLASASGAGDGDMLNSAAFALGVASAGNIVTQVRTGLGLDTLAVEGGAEDGRLIAGKRFGSRLFVEYGYGLIDKLGTLLLRYQLSDRIILESRTGTVSNFDVLYRVRKR